MKNRLGITEGKVYAIDFAGFYRILDGEFYENKDLLDKSETPDKEVESNTKLIVNAFETANKTGLLPSELLKQRDELLSSIKEAKATLEMWKDVAPAVSLIKEMEELIKSI